MKQKSRHGVLRQTSNPILATRVSFPFCLQVPLRRLARVHGYTNTGDIAGATRPPLSSQALQGLPCPEGCLSLPDLLRTTGGPVSIALVTTRGLFCSVPEQDMMYICTYMHQIQEYIYNVLMWDEGTGAGSTHVHFCIYVIWHVHQ